MHQIRVLLVDGHVRDDAHAESQANVGLDHVRIARGDGDVRAEARLGKRLVQRGGPVKLNV